MKSSRSPAAAAAGTENSTTQGPIPHIMACSGLSCCNQAVARSIHDRGRVVGASDPGMVNPTSSTASGELASCSKRSGSGTATTAWGWPASARR